MHSKRQKMTERGIRDRSDLMEKATSYFCMLKDYVYH